MDQTLKAQQHLDVIQKKIIQLEEKAAHDPEVHLQLKHLQHQVEFLRAQIREHVDSWRKTDLSRHSQRPYTLDYVKRLFANWNEIHGDRCFGDDPAIVCGMAKYHGEQVMVIGQQKGRTTKERVFRNFSQANPEGYRKALRCMKMAEKFARPVFTFVDTQGAYPGIEAEERGQGEAIARNLREMARLTVPTIATVIGEGTSGGALAIAVADRVLMMENAIYSVISPEGSLQSYGAIQTRKKLPQRPCASLLWISKSWVSLMKSSLSRGLEHIPIMMLQPRLLMRLYNAIMRVSRTNPIQNYSMNVTRNFVRWRSFLRNSTS